MKKALAIALTFALLLCVFAFPVNAAQTDGRYYRQFLRQYYNGETPSVTDAEYMTYNELYYHTTDGVTDWALIEADFGCACEVLIQDIHFGRAFAHNDDAPPFHYGYGIYDAAQERFFGFDEITDENDYPDLQNVLDRFCIGQRVGETHYGDDLRYKEQFLRKAVGSYVFEYGEANAVKCYDELYYHENAGQTDWVLVRGETWFRYPEGGTYEKIGNTVLRTEGIYEPFGNGYAVYDVGRGVYYELRASLIGRFNGLIEALNSPGVGEKIGDLNGDRRVNVNDITDMQRCLAEVQDYPEKDGVEAVGYKNRGAESVQYLSDIDKNGERDVRDITALQRILAEF